MSVTVEELNQQAELIAGLRLKETEANRAKKEISDELERAEFKMLELLTHANLPNYRAPAGLVSVVTKSSVKLPQGEDRVLFYNFLKEKDLFESMIGVNSQTLNKFYKDQMDLAIAEGNTEFAIPGIQGVTLTQSLSFRSA